MKEIAVEGLTYQLSSPASETAPNSATISPPSMKVKAGGKGVYRGNVTFTFTPGSISHPAWSASSTNTAPATFTVSPSGVTKVKADGQICLCVGDESAQIPVTGMMVSGPSTAPSPQMISLKISDAGQNKVKGG